MNKMEISEEILEMAEKAGLSVKQLQTLLYGGAEVPDELFNLFERICQTTAEAVSGGS